MIDTESKKIRQTNEINSFYINTKYEKLIKGYTFNYNYDTLPLDTPASNLIPSYIKEIVN